MEPSSGANSWFVQDTDIAYEEGLLRDPFNVKIWYCYAKSKVDAEAISTRFLIYERAIQNLPGSFKLWWNYLKDRVTHALQQQKTFENHIETRNCFLRCLIHHSKKPRIWLDFCAFLERQKKITETRRMYDESLRSLPITQHDLIWPAYLKFVDSCGVVETAVRVYPRYLLLEPDQVERYVQYLIKEEKWDEAACQLSKIVDDESFVSSQNKTNHQLWMELCDIITAHPEHITSLKAEPIIRTGLQKYTFEVGRLWCALADHFIRLGQMEKARDVFEEGITSVLTLQDFVVIFDGYTAFLESTVNALMQNQNQNLVLLDMNISRLEFLMDHRPELVSSVKLRQNPHNVHEWLARVNLYRDQPSKIIETYSEAIATIDPSRSVGRLSTLWSQFAKYYESHGDIDNARHIFESSTKVNFRGLDDLASMWCERIEMELRHQNYDIALKVARQSVNQSRDTDRESVQSRLYRSVKLWCLCLDMEEMFGTLDTLKATYDKMFTLKVMTPQLVINTAHMLEERGFFEESFRVYERGVALFKWPHVNDIWLMYLTKFVSRYGNRKLERSRDLFEQAIETAPPEWAKSLYLLYAKLEEEFGLSRHAIDIYRRATKAVKPDEKLDMYLIYIAKTTDAFGIAKTRKIFEEAIDNILDSQVRTLSLMYANVEKGLGEIDRSRAIYQHSSQYCDPNKDPEFWKIWREFEVAHGNEDTFRDMLRIKRSVQAQYSQVHFNVSELAGNTAPAVPLDPMSAAEFELEKKLELEQAEKSQDATADTQYQSISETNDLAEAELEFRQKFQQYKSKQPVSNGNVEMLNENKGKDANEQIAIDL